jgi:uncharacterized phage infection (PIP) family protein YhgE
LATTSSIVFAKGRDNHSQPKHKVKATQKHSTSLQKGIQSIAPKSTTSAAIDPVIAAQVEVVKNAYTTYSTTVKQINTKNSNTSKLIMQIRKSKKTLSNDQYTALNALIATINTEATKIVNIKGIDNVIRIANLKNTSKQVQVTLADLTTMLSSINDNTTHLNTISATYDLVNSTLTTVANTTPAAVTIK